jgi:maleylacetate reductase
VEANREDAGVKALDAFDHDALPGRVVFAPGEGAERLAGLIDEVGAERVLVVCTPTGRARAEALSEGLGSRRVGVFGDARVHVPVEVAGAAVAAAKDAQADWVVAIGGGSPVGVAKAIALELGLPILAVPTTYSGSEMTPIWGMTEESRKTTGRSMAVLPRIVLYDPELTVGLPARTTATSAVNALAHCVEAFYAPGASPISSLLAEEGIRALVGGIPDAVAAPEDLEARGLLLYGAYLAGASSAQSGTEIHHKICHVLGGALDLPHAETHTVVLPQVVAFVEPALPADARLRIRGALGAGEAGAAVAIFDLVASVDVPTSLKELGMPRDAIEPLFDQILSQVPPSTPRPPSRDDLRGILDAAWEGRRPSSIPDPDRTHA